MKLNSHVELYPSQSRSLMFKFNDCIVLRAHISAYIMHSLFFGFFIDERNHCSIIKFCVKQVKLMMKCDKKISRLCVGVIIFLTASDFSTSKNNVFYYANCFHVCFSKQWLVNLSVTVYYI